jgi:hypothetical protein
VVYERVLNRWQRVMPLEMLWFTNVFRGKCKSDKRGHLQRFKQEFGPYTTKLPLLKDKNPLKAHMLKHSLLQYDRTRFKDITTLEFETT